jgi:multidrug efflux pump subunit AcrA (membrane-fusion protein)
VESPLRLGRIGKPECPAAIEERIVCGVRGGWLSVGLAAFVATVGCRGGEESRPAAKPATPSLVVTLSPAAIRAAGIETALVGKTRLAPMLLLTGTVAAKPWLPEEEAALANAESADARLRLAEANYGRLSRLFADGVAARQDVDTARAERDQARAAAAQADAQRANLGLSADSRTLEDRAKIWGLASLPDSDLARVRPGERVRITTAAFPDQPFSGEVIGISRSADPETRNFTVRIALRDASGQLHPQMLATFSVETPAPAGLAVPRSALLLEGDGSYVYVVQGDSFRKQAVRIGASTADQVDVVGGLSAGDRVVVRGAQILESERLKSRLEAADTD